MSLSLRLMTSSSAMDKPRASADWSHRHRLPAFELIAQRGAVISSPRTPPSNSRIESDLALDCEPCRDQKTEHHQAHDRAVICEPSADAVLRPVAPLELYDGVHSACPRRGTVRNATGLRVPWLPLVLFPCSICFCTRYSCLCVRPKRVSLQS